MGRALREIKKMMYGNSISRMARGGRSKISGKMFTDAFEQKHLSTLKDSRVTGSGVPTEAVKKYKDRSKQEAFTAHPPVPHDNTLIGMSPMTRRYAERHLKKPAIQAQLVTGQPVDIPLPRPNRGDQGPARHRAYAARVTSSFGYTTYNQPSLLRVRGAPHPAGYWQANHLEGVVQGRKSPTKKSIARRPVITFPDVD